MELFFWMDMSDSNLLLENQYYKELFDSCNLMLSFYTLIKTNSKLLH